MGEPADPQVLESAEGQLGIALPTDYKEVLLRHDGFEGPIGAAGYLVIWSAAELTTLNRDYAADEFVPGIVLFGSDGGDTGYGFDTRAVSTQFAEIPLVGMNLDSVRPVAETFEGFIERLNVRG